MIYYVLTFMLSAYLIYLSQKKKNKIFLFLSLLIPCILAGIRNISVGTDVEIYIIPNFNYAKSFLVFKEYLTYMNYDQKEIGYSLMNYVLANCFNSIQWILFIYQLITTLFIYLSFRQLSSKYKIPLWLCMLLYYFALYNRSLNIIRQCMAVSIVFYGLSIYLTKNKLFTYILLILIASLIHTSSFIALLYIPIKELFKDCDNKTILSRITLFISCIGILIIFFPISVKTLVKYAIINSNYLEYLPGGMHSLLDKPINILNICFILPECFYLYLLFINRKKIDTPYLFIMNTILLILINLSAFYAQYLPRIGYYFIPLQCMNMAYIADKNNKKTIIIGIYAMIWFICFIILNMGETMPYLTYWM